MIPQSLGGLEEPGTLPLATAKAKCENQKIYTLPESRVPQSPGGLE